MMCHQTFKRSRALSQTGVLPGFGYVGCVVLALWVSAASAYGSYTLTPLSDVGQDAVTVVRGGSFALDLVLTSDTAADETDAVRIDVIFSLPGLRFDSVTWHDQFGEAGVTTGNTPISLPAIISEDSRPGNDIDVRVEAITLSDPFTSGRFVSLGLTVPSNFTSNIVTIGINQFLIDNDGAPVTTNVGPDLTLNVVPEPGSALLLGVGGVLLGFRRRSV